MLGEVINLIDDIPNAVNEAIENFDTAGSTSNKTQCAAPSFGNDFDDINLDVSQIF